MWRNIVHWNDAQPDIAAQERKMTRSPTLLHKRGKSALTWLSLAKSYSTLTLFTHFLVILSDYSWQIHEPNWKDKSIDRIFYFYFIFMVQTLNICILYSTVHSINIKRHHWTLRCMLLNKEMLSTAWFVTRVGLATILTIPTSDNATMYW